MRHHGAAVIRLSHDPISTERLGCIDSTPSPIGGRHAAGLIGQHIAPTVHPQARDDDALTVPTLPIRAGWIDAYDHPGEVWNLVDATAIQHCERPQCTGKIIEDLCVELLPTYAGSFIAITKPLERGRCEISRVLVCAAAGDVRAWIIDKPPDQGRRLWCRRDHHLRMLAEPQPEL